MNAYDMGKHAYSTVPLYYNLAEKRQLNIEDISFAELPIVDKGFYVDSGMSMISSQYISNYMNQELHYTRTSGSTGKFSEVYWKQEDYNHSLVSLWIWRKKYYQITPGDRMAYFFPADQGETGSVVLEHALALSRSYLSNGELENAYEKILEYEPVWMILQPNLALLLSNIAKERGKIPESLRYIEFTGEFLEIPVRQQIEEVFQCITANQYGTKEVNSIAYECPEGTLHIMQDNVYLETLGDQDGEGELCVTSLHNFAMPFVRFNLEDRGRIIRSKPCSCGRCTDVLELSAGRSNDWIQCKDGTRIHAYTLVQIIHQANYEMDGQIVQYQIIQQDFDSFEVILMLDETEVLPVLSEYVIKRFREKLGEVEIVVHLSDGLIPSERTGKLADFVSNVG
ncbi:MAG: hypothetical protein NC489_35860 [Ruminococcus flavefaciens]|nr:hypothetical protein [Ruminococcus flavefaciens]